MNRRKIIQYKSHLKELARNLRNNSTKTEILLWNELKKRKMKGFDFDRQKPIDEYIVDFYCKDLMLAIEIDGESHIGEEKYDKVRQQRLENLGVRFLRFNSLDVFYKLDKVVNEIEKWIDTNAK
ncbi:MAG: endonuclease domain-containing protein [Bacteroidota bacterium]